MADTGQEEVQNFIDDDDFGHVGVDLGAATTVNNYNVGAPTVESLSRSFSGQEKNKSKKQPNGGGVGNRVAQSLANMDSNGNQFLNSSETLKK